MRCAALAAAAALTAAALALATAALALATAAALAAAALALTAAGRERASDERRVLALQTKRGPARFFGCEATAFPTLCSPPSG